MELDVYPNLISDYIEDINLKLGGQLSFGGFIP
jgi:hypothetical protein